MVIIPNWFVSTFVHSQLREGTDEGPIFIRKVWDCPQYMVIGALGGVGTYDFWT